MRSIACGMFAGVVALIGAGTAQARCAEFEVSAADLSVQYDPFVNAMVDRPFTMRVRRLDPAVRSVRFVLATGGTGGGTVRVGAGGPAVYEMVWNRDAGRRVLVAGAEQPNATNGAVASFEAGPGGDLAVETFRLRIPPGQTVTGGSHSQTFEVRYQCSQGPGEDEPVDLQIGAQVLLNVQVPQQISSYVGSFGQRRGTIDFGTLGASAPPRSLSVTVQSTVPYQVEMREDRRGLRRGEGDAAVIPYRVRLSGVEVGDGGQISCDGTPMPTGRNHMLEVDLDQHAIAAVPAGRYSDVITLTFVPRAGLGGGSACSAL